MSDHVPPASSRSTGAASNTHAAAEAPVQTELHAGALGLPAVIMQSVTTMAPAIGIVLILQFIASFTGVTAPFAFVIIGIILLVMAIALGELARNVSSASAFFTYASRAIHPRVGFITGWIFSIAYPLGPGFLIAFLALTVERTLDAQWNVFIPWWVTFVVVATLVSAVVYRGIALSAKSLILFGAIEMAIIFLLALWSLFEPGPGGVNLESFNPGNATSATGLYLAVVFSLFALIGWEEAAPLAEETDNPRRNIPLAMIISVIVVGVFFVFCAWGVLVGFGTDNIQGLIDSEEAPAFVLADRFWGDAGTVLILLALTNASIAAPIASYNAATRMWFGMGRQGALPRFLGKVHPRHKTPVNAIYLEIAVTFTTGLFFGFLMGPEDYFGTFGLINALSIALFLTIVMVGVTCYFWRFERRQFSVVRHGLLPAVGAVAMLWVLYKSIVPLPPAPIKWAIPAVVAWILLGLAVLMSKRRAGQEEWLLAADAPPQAGAATSGERAAV